jgi:hypothetical protein
MEAELCALVNDLLQVLSMMHDADYGIARVEQETDRIK